MMRRLRYILLVAVILDALAVVLNILCDNLMPAFYMAAITILTYVVYKLSDPRRG